MPRPHLVLLSFDTLRRDHLGCYGYPRDVAPQLDRLAAGGVRCAEAVANCGWTLPQHGSLLTGCYPLTHGLLLMREQPPLADSTVTLAEHLHGHGYQTFAGVSERNHYGGGAKYGFDRGFDQHVPGASYNRHMGWTERFIVESLEAHHAHGPCFVYAHVNDTHEPFDPPPPWHGLWGQGYVDIYDSELSYVDYHVGRIVGELQRLGIHDQTLIVCFGDHGTEFWEHGFYEKKVNLYNEILNIPLLFHWPAGLPAGRVVDGFVETVDIAPTIVDLAELPPIPTAQGRSLKPRLLGRGGEVPEFVCSHTRHEHQQQGGPVQFEHAAIVSHPYKFIRLTLQVPPDELCSDWKQRLQALALRVWRDPSELVAGLTIRELYDLRDDPYEQRTLLPEGPAQGPRRLRLTEVVEAPPIAADLEAKLDAWLTETAAAAPR